MTCNWELYMGAFLSLQLEQEYNITIPRSDAKKLKTVGNTVDFIERREHCVSKGRSRQRRVKARCAMTNQTSYAVMWADAGAGLHWTRRGSPSGGSARMRGILGVC